MPNHHIVSDADAEKGYEAQQYGYDKQTTHTEEPFVHGAATVGEATGRGGNTHRGLKSRHIQFLYVTVMAKVPSEWTNTRTGLLEVLSEQASSLDLEQSLLWSVLHRSSWPIWP